MLRRGTAMQPFGFRCNIATFKMVAIWAMLIFLSRAANGQKGVPQLLITFVNQYGEADTIRDYLAAKDNTDDFARREGACNRTIPLGVE